MAYTIINGLCTLADVKSALRVTDTVDDDRISLAIDSASRWIEGACNRRFWQDPVPRIDSGCTLNATSTVLDPGITLADASRRVTDVGGLIPANALVGNPDPGVGYTLVDPRGVTLTAGGSASDLDVTIGLAARIFVATDPWEVEVDDISTTVGLVYEVDYAGDGSFSTTWQVQDYQTEPLNGINQGQAGWPVTLIRAVRSQYDPVWGGIAYPKPYTQALVMITARWGWTAVPANVRQAAIIQSLAVFKAVDVPFGATPFGETGVLRLKESLHPTAAQLLELYMEDEVLVA